MAKLGYHLMCRLEDDRVIAPKAWQRRLVARRVLEICRHAPLLCFHLVDSHLHLQLLAALEECMRLIQRIQASIKRRLALDVSFTPARKKPIADQGHLFNLFDYILRQQTRHGLDWDPCFDASNLPDLLGLRTLGAYTARLVRERLPRINRPYLLGRLGVPDLQPTDGPLELLPQAALAAAGLNDFSGAQGRAARIAALAVAGAKLPVVTLGELLAIDRRTISRLRPLAPDPLMVHAIRLQLALRATIAKEQGPDAPLQPSEKAPLFT